MDQILQLHVQHHSSSSLPGAARLSKSVDATRALLALAAIASLALLLPASLLAAAGSGLLTTKTALFVLSNAIFVLLAADCRCWFFAAGASAGDAVIDACDESVLEKQGRHHHQEEVRQCAVQVQPRVVHQGCLENKNISTVSLEVFTEPAMVADSTTTLEALEEEEEEEDVPGTSRPELLELPDEGESIALELEAVVVEEPSEPTCETARELDELGIDELNKKFDEFIQSRRAGWEKEETYLQWHQGLTC